MNRLLNTLNSPHAAENSCAKFSQYRFQNGLQDLQFTVCISRQPEQTGTGGQLQLQQESCRRGVRGSAGLRGGREESARPPRRPAGRPGPPGGAGRPPSLAPSALNGGKEKQRRTLTGGRGAL